MYSEVGAYGSLEQALFPIHHGILNFVGFTVLEPFFVYGPARLSNDERLSHLSDYRERIQRLCSPGRVVLDDKASPSSASAPVIAKLIK